ncbi:hypothetical protein KXX44_000544, partial [Aspergillus fumigatus]
MRNKVITRYPYYSGPYFQVYRDSTALDDFDISLRLQMQGMGCGSTQSSIRASGCTHSGRAGV